jgi:hypothetical protein
VTTCKCIAETWTEQVRPPVCSVYTAGMDGYCEECWHDKACHLLSEDEIRADERAKVIAEIKGRLGL